MRLWEMITIYKAPKCQTNWLLGNAIFFVKRDSSEENIGIFMLGCKELRFSASIYTWSWHFKNFGVGQARRKSLWNLTLSLALFVYAQWRDRGSNLTTPDPDVSRILELDKQEESLPGILLWACMALFVYVQWRDRGSNLDHWSD